MADITPISIVSHCLSIRCNHLLTRFATAGVPGIALSRPAIRHRSHQHGVCPGHVLVACPSGNHRYHEHRTIPRRLSCLRSLARHLL